MSSILDALRKLEAAQVQASKRGVFMPPPKSRRWPAIAAGVAFVAGVGLTLWLSGHRPGEPTGQADVEKDAKPAPGALTAATRPAKPAPVEPPVAPSPEHAPVPVAPTQIAAATPPTAPITPPPIATAAPPLAAPPAPAPVAVAPPPTALRPAAPAPPLPRAVVDEQPPRGRVAPPASPAPAAREPEAPPPVARATREPVASPPPVRQPVEEEEEPEVVERPPADAPRVQLSFLVYSRIPERRAVALTVEGGSLQTLHEGESTGEIEVEQIKSNSVRLRHRGRTFTLRPRD